MPADQGEIRAVIEEGIEIIELTAPEKDIEKDGRVAGLLCSRMELKGVDSRRQTGSCKRLTGPNLRYSATQ
ncbi:MAG: hypothetical protein MZV63_49205 [Marinilabiliales bacterium]|nr:hypothetical protein [Marinilabiliales bacterium]